MFFQDMLLNGNDRGSLLWHCRAPKGKELLEKPIDSLHGHDCRTIDSFVLLQDVNLKLQEADLEVISIKDCHLVHWLTIHQRAIA